MKESTSPEPLAKVHPVREAIITYLGTKLGTNLQTLCQEIAIPRGTATHHLNALQRSQTIACIDTGRERYFFLDTDIRSPLDQGAMQVLLRGRAKELAQAIVNNPGSIQKTLLDELDMRRNTFRAHMERFIEFGLIEEIDNGRTNRYQPTPWLVHALRKLSRA